MKNLLKTKCVFLVLLLYMTSSGQSFSQSKIMVSGLGGEHDSLVAECVRQAYRDCGGDTVYVSRSTAPLNQSFVDSLKSSGYSFCVRSTTGYNSYKYLAKNNPEIIFLMPAGSNSYINTGITLGRMISTGAGDTLNHTGYPIHYYDSDVTGSGFLSSYSNGYIAGKIARIKDSLNCSISEALLRAEYSTGNPLTLTNGFGKINFSNAVTLTLPILGNIGKIIALNLNGNITVTIDPVTNAEYYEIYRNGTLLDTTSSLLYTYIQARSFEEKIKLQYRASLDGGYSPLSDPFYTRFKKYKLIPIN